MSTRSAIMAEVNGEHIGVYCHFDGYPEGVGATLAEHYADDAKILELLALGNLSSLGAEIGEKHDFGRLASEAPPEEKAWTTAYHRDRGDAWDQVKPAHKPTFDELYEWFNKAVAYVYLWRGGEWLVTKTYGDDVPRLRAMPEAIAAEAAENE